MVSLFLRISLHVLPHLYLHKFQQLVQYELVPKGLVVLGLVALELVAPQEYQFNFSEKQPKNLYLKANSRVS
jgi:hypothetical protein